MKKRELRTLATLRKTKSFRAGAMLMKRRAPELWYFYDGSTALFKTSTNKKFKRYEQWTNRTLERTKHWQMWRCCHAGTELSLWK